MIQSHPPCVILSDDWESQIRENPASPPDPPHWSPFSAGRTPAGYGKRTDLESKGTKVILIAEDDDDTYLLTEEAFRQTEPREGKLRRVKDGEELMDTLLHEPRPSVILLDLNMPKKDGRKALREIRSHPSLHTIPVVILSTSDAPEDVNDAYNLGANSYIRKPSSFEKMVTVLQEVQSYWLNLVELPVDRPQVNPYRLHQEGVL